MADQDAMSTNGRVRHINKISRQPQQRSVLPVRLLDVARMMENSLPQNSSSDGIHFDKPRGTEWLNGVFQRHINLLESDLVEACQSPSVLPRGLPSSRLGQWLIAWEEESVLEKARGVAEAGSTPMERDEAEYFTTQNSVVSSVMVVDTKKKAGGPGETKKAEYLKRVKDLDLEYLASRQRLVDFLGLKSLSHEDLSNHYCVDWLKAHEAHFSRDKTL